MKYIYAIKGYGMTYYGSSMQPLYERKSSHKTQYKFYKNQEEGQKKCCASYLILDCGDDWDIEVVEELPDDIPREEMLMRENYYITNYECINKNQSILTDEQKREYQRQWAEKKRRELGVPVRDKIITADEKKYAREWMAKKRASMTDEEKAEHLKHRRETRPEQTEEQKEEARRRAKEQREKIKNDPELLAKAREYKRLKAAEYRNKKKEAII